MTKNKSIKNFFILHDEIIKDPRHRDFEYIIFVESTENINHIKLEGISDKIYCMHLIDQSKMTFDNTDDIDILTHDGGIIAKYKKIYNEPFELWGKIQ